MEEKYTVEEVADKLKVSKRTILREIKRGKLDVQKAGRRYLISQKALDKYVQTDIGDSEEKIEQFLASKKGEMVDLLQKLVSMQTADNQLGQEARSANFIKTILDKNDIRSVVYEENSAVAVRGSFGWADEGLLLDCPLDTTSPGDTEKWSYPPFEGVIKGGKMYGRGTADCKAGIVAMIYAVLALKKYVDEEKVRVELVFDGGEQEGDYLGMRLALEKGLPVKAGIVGYAGDDHELFIGARGYHRYTFTTKGVSAHTGARKRVGVNAIDKMVDFVSVMNRINLPKAKDKLFSFGQRMTFSQIQGGRQINIVPDLCTARLDLRTTPDFTKPEVDKMIENTIKKMENNDDQFDIEYHYDVGQEGYLLEKKDRLTELLQKRIVEKYPHRKLRSVATGPAHIGNLLYGNGVPVVLWGPRGGNVHAYDEYVELDSIPETAEIYTRTILDYFKDQ